jgi:hypothetical protein
MGESDSENTQKSEPENPFEFPEPLVRRKLYEEPVAPEDDISDLF